MKNSDTLLDFHDRSVNLAERSDGSDYQTFDQNCFNIKFENKDPEELFPSSIFKKQD